MNSKLNIHNRIWSIVLTMALLFPAMSQLAHQLEEHAHVVCADFDTHLHQSEIECPIQDFHLNSFALSSQNLDWIQLIATNMAPIIHSSEAVLTKPHYDYSLRGPPLVS